MVSRIKPPGATVIPTLRYNDVAAAVEWLCRAFGFKKHLVVLEDNGTVAHAELTFGNGMIMLDPARDGLWPAAKTPWSS